MLEYLDKVIIPYTYGRARNVLDVPEDQPALAIFNVFTAHHCNNVVEKLQSDNRSSCQPAALVNYSQWMFVSMTDFKSHEKLIYVQGMLP